MILKQWEEFLNQFSKGRMLFLNERSNLIGSNFKRKDIKYRVSLKETRT